MITDQDVDKLKGTFATKDELVNVKSELKSEIADVRLEVGELREEMNERFDSLEVKFDAMLGLFMDTRQENAVGAVQYARHDRQIQALAVGTGTTLPD